MTNKKGFEQCACVHMTAHEKIIGETFRVILFQSIVEEDNFEKALDSARELIMNACDQVTFEIKESINKRGKGVANEFGNRTTNRLKETVEDSLAYIDEVRNG